MGILDPGCRMGVREGGFEPTDAPSSRQSAQMRQMAFPGEDLERPFLPVGGGVGKTP